MSVSIPTKAITVYLWGHRVGALFFGSDGYSRFQYFPDFVKRGIEIAPFEMPLSGKVYSAADFELPRNAFWGMPGAFADSLPDSFGNKLVAEWMRRNGYSLDTITPLDRLAYIGSRGMGALVYNSDIRKNEEVPAMGDTRKTIPLYPDLSRRFRADLARERNILGRKIGEARKKAGVLIGQIRHEP